MRKIIRNVIITGIFAFFICSPHLFAQDFSGLQDEILTEKKKMANSLLGGILGAINPGSTRGKIDEIRVINDSETELRIRIEYSEIDDGFLKIKFLDKNNKLQKAITGDTEINLAEHGNPLDLVFQLNGDSHVRKELISSFLGLSFRPSKYSVPGVTKTYNLNKKWLLSGPGGDIVTIRPEPIGSAAELKSNNTKLVLPKQIVTLKTSNPSKAKPPTYRRPSISNSSRRPTTTSTSRRPTTTSTSRRPTTTSTSRRPTTTSSSRRPTTTSSSRRPTTTNSSVRRASTSRSVNSGTKIAAIHTQKNAAKGVKYGDKMKRPNNKTSNPTKEPTNQSEEPTKQPEGPINQSISLWEELHADAEFNYSHEVTNISMTVFPDSNPASGVFYYTPLEFHIEWSENEGYALNMDYGTSTDSEAGKVHMNVTLTAGISVSEIRIVKKLLESYLEQQDSDRKKYGVKLQPMPTSETPQVLFSLDDFEVEEENVSVSGINSLAEPFSIKWVTDSRTKEEIQLALTNEVGIGGIMAFKPDGDDLPDFTFPVRIALSDKRTIGRFKLQPKSWRKSMWTNNAPYPIKLNKLHMLVIKESKGESIPVIYSWDLGNRKINRAGKVAFDASDVPVWLDDPDNTERIWLDYSLADCSSCDNDIIAELTGGTSGAETAAISFETFNIIEQTGAEFLILKIRSDQASLGSKKTSDLESIKMEEDETEYTAGPLYVSSNGVSFEYLPVLVMPDGDSYKADKWIKSYERKVYIGPKQIRNAISNLPEQIRNAISDLSE